MVRALLEKLKEVNIKIQKTHKSKNAEFYGSNEGDNITLAISTCMQDGGVKTLVETAIHELLHATYPHYDERTVQKLSKQLYRKSYRLRAEVAMRVLHEVIVQKR